MAAVVALIHADKSHYEKLCDVVTPLQMEALLELTRALKKGNEDKASNSKETVERLQLWAHLALIYRILVERMDSYDNLFRRPTLIKVIGGFIVQTLRYLSLDVNYYRFEHDIPLLRFNFIKLVDAVVSLADGSKDDLDVMFPGDMRLKLAVYLGVFVDKSPSAAARKEAEAAYNAAQVAESDSNKTIAAIVNFLAARSESLALVAARAFASLMRGPAVSPEMLKPGSPVLAIIEALVDDELGAVSKHVQAGRRALANFVQTNYFKIAPHVLEQCYSSRAPIAEAFFLALCSALHGQIAGGSKTKKKPDNLRRQSVVGMLLGLEKPVLATLLLSKLGDASLYVRQASMELLREMHKDSAFVTPADCNLTSSIPETYRHSQVMLAGQLADAHPERAEMVAAEVVHRMGIVSPFERAAMLHFLAPWLSFVSRKTSDVAAVVKSLLGVTEKYGYELSGAVGQCWAALAVGRSEFTPGRSTGNVQEVVDELLGSPYIRGGKLALHVCKQVALYVSRAMPKATVLYLMSQMVNPYSTTGGVGPAQSTGQQHLADFGDHLYR